MNLEWLKQATLVPMPPSKMKSDPLYDDRLLQLLQKIQGRDSFDIRELVVQVASMDAAHSATNRPTPRDLEQNYQIEETVCVPEPRVIGLFDDILTTGSHFKAATRVLKRRFPAVKIIGIFVARRAVVKTEE